MCRRGRRESGDQEKKKRMTVFVFGYWLKWTTVQSTCYYVLKRREQVVKRMKFIVTVMNRKEKNESTCTVLKLNELTCYDDVVKK